MSFISIDIDTLRADHVGFQGYPRSTTPHLDQLAQSSVVFERCYASDVPCLPSRTALFGGRFGSRNGVVGHGGTSAEPFIEGSTRGFFSQLGKTSWPALMRKRGLRTASISSFAARHGAHHFCAGLDELISPGKLGLENADQVCELATDWITRHRDHPSWFLHVHLWTRTRRIVHEVRAMFNGYDTGVRFADEQLGKLLERLRELALDDQTPILVSADHGETLGELNINGDHHTADEHTAARRLSRLSCMDAVRWERDPHEHHDLADAAPELVQAAARKLMAWENETMSRNPGAVIPLQTVLAEGAPWHTRGRLAAYLERLCATGRSQLAERLALAHPREHAGEQGA